MHDFISQKKQLFKKSVRKLAAHNDRKYKEKSPVMIVQMILNVIVLYTFRVLLNLTWWWKLCTIYNHSLSLEYVPGTKFLSCRPASNALLTTQLTALTTRQSPFEAFCFIFQAFVMFASTYMLVALSIDRYDAIARPLFFSTTCTYIFSFFYIRMLEGLHLVSFFIKNFNW